MIGKTYVNKGCPMPESRADRKQILLFSDEAEDFLLGFANKGKVEITIKVVKEKGTIE